MPCRQAILFQFHKVQLKERFDWTRDSGNADFNSIRYN